MKTKMLLAIFAFALISASTAQSWYHSYYGPYYGYGYYGYGCGSCRRGCGWYC